jgi:hypothetical protein
MEGSLVFRPIASAAIWSIEIPFAETSDPVVLAMVEQVSQPAVLK